MRDILLHVSIIIRSYPMYILLHGIVQKQQGSYNDITHIFPCIIIHNFFRKYIVTVQFNIHTDLQSIILQSAVEGATR